MELSVFTTNLINFSLIHVFVTMSLQLLMKNLFTKNVRVSPISLRDSADACLIYWHSWHYQMSSASAPKISHIFIKLYTHFPCKFKCKYEESERDRVPNKHKLNIN